MGLGRAFRRFGRAFRHVSRRGISRTVRRLDPKFPKKVHKIVSDEMSSLFEQNLRNKKEIRKEEVVSRIKRKITPDVKRSTIGTSMEGLDSTINGTIDRMIEESWEYNRRKYKGRIKIRTSTPFRKFLSRVLFPIAVCLIIGGVSYLYPQDIPPGNIILEPVIPPTGGNPIPPDPLSISALNGLIYGIGALVLILVIAGLRRK